MGTVPKDQDALEDYVPRAFEDTGPEEDGDFDA